MQLILANAGIPMLVLMLPVFVVTLPVVIVIETWVSARGLDLSFPTLLGPLARANLLTTIAGIPVAWGLLLGLEYLVGFTIWNLWPRAGAQLAPAIRDVVTLLVSAPWLGMGVENRPWLVPGAALVLLFPFGVTSWWVERWYIAMEFPDVPRAAIHRALLRANVASYLGFAVLCVAWLLVELVVGPR